MGANTFRNPALVAKMVTTMDLISDGRAVLGIGAAWFEVEHTAFGIDFGDGLPGSDCAGWRRRCPSCAACSTAHEPTVTEGRYRTESVLNDPPPVQAHLPILIGGTGRKVTLKLAAQYADMYNMGNGDIEDARDVEATLVEHCRAVGRDERRSSAPWSCSASIIRDSREEAFRVQDEILAHNGGAEVDEDRPKSATLEANRGCVGTVDDVVEHCRPYVELGYRHLICCYPSPFDEESMTRMATEVRPRLEALIG